MNKGFIRESADLCPVCKTHTLLAYDAKYNRQIHYITKNPSATTESIMEKVNDRQIRDLVCSKCGKHFLLDFSLGYPRAIEKFALNMTFFDGYFHHNEKER